jgi:septal ring factor EnvC (AmiA/AmiB activator)
MTNIIHPEKDRPVDHMKIHKDVVWVIRTLWGGGLALVFAAMWVASLAADVEQNKEDVKNAATQDQLTTTVEILKRLETKIDKQDERQRTIQDSLTRLETKVEKLEEEVEE